MNYVATGKKVDDALVLEPKCFEEDSNEDLRKKTVMLSEGDILLSNMRVQLRALGMKTEYKAHEDEEQLIVNNSIVVR